MTDKKATVNLPVFNGREFDDKTREQFIQLAALLRDTAYDFVVKQTSMPPHVIGAAFYAAVWDLSESLSPAKQAEVRSACLYTMLANDKTFALVTETSSQFPN